MGSYTLTEGSLAMMRGGNQVQSAIMQILNSRRTVKVYNILSDGKYYISNVVFKTKSKRTAPREVTKFSILKIKKYALRTTGKPEKQVLEIMNFDVLAKGDEINKRIGFPKRISRSFHERNVNINAKPVQKDDVAELDTKMNVTHTIANLRPELNDCPLSSYLKFVESLRHFKFYT